MTSGYQVVDVKNWKRAMHCEVFRHSVEPQYCVTLELDITNFRQKVRERGLAFSFAFIYAVTKCANEIEEFRYRFQDGEVVLYDEIHTSFTYMNHDTELFKVVGVPMQDTMEAYNRIARETADSQEAYFTGPPGNDTYQFSAMPWITYTHVSHTNSGRKENAVPLFDWGKYFEREGRLLMPFSIQVHHSFVDGIHVGKLVKKLQKYLDDM